MKLCAVSPFVSARPKTVLRFLKLVSADLVLLPGIHENTPSPLSVERVIRPGVHVFVEDHDAPYLVSRGARRRMPPQVFSHNPTASEMDLLAQSLPARTFEIAARHVTFFICGELIAFNPDGSAKHHRSLPHDVVANPAHTMMGHWNHLGRKLATLSRSSACLYATNNDCEHNNVTSNVRIYEDGELVAVRHKTAQLMWSECEI